MVGALLLMHIIAAVSRRRSAHDARGQYRRRLASVYPQSLTCDPKKSQAKRSVHDVGTADGKVAIVTGASRGIGRAVAERLGRDGARVVVNYVQNAGKAQEVVEAVEASGSEAVAVQADIGRLEDVRRLFHTAEERFGGWTW
jgi:3-oxoacyl-ACP reductase-like protein